MADALKFNVDDLHAQAKAIDTIRDRLQSSKNSLTSNLRIMQTEWVSDSSKKFFDQYDTSWVQYIDKYCIMLEEVSRELKYAAESYDPLTEEFNRINLNV